MIICISCISVHHGPRRYAEIRSWQRKRLWPREIKGNCFSRPLFRIVNMAYRHCCCCPITYIFHVWNHAWLFLPRGQGGPTQRERPRPQCSTSLMLRHRERERGLVLEPWAKSTVPLALSDGGEKGGATVWGREEIRSPDGGVHRLWLLLTYSRPVILLWACLTPPLPQKKSLLELLIRWFYLLNYLKCHILNKQTKIDINEYKK